MNNEHDKPIVIIKRIKKVAAKHHGGSWKIAYADFVTAMMAFFLMMWLLSLLNKYQLQGIAEYFRKPLKEVFNKQDNVAKTDTIKPDMLGPTTYKNKGSKEKTENSAEKNLGLLDKAVNPSEQTQSKPKNEVGKTLEENKNPLDHTQSIKQKEVYKAQGQQVNQVNNAASAVTPQQDPKQQTHTQAAAATAAIAEMAKANDNTKTNDSEKSTDNQQQQKSAQQNKEDAAPVMDKNNPNEAKQQNQFDNASTVVSENVKNANKEWKQMQEMKNDLQKKMENDPQMSQFKHSLNFTVTSDGLKITLRDLENKPMFSTGKTDFEKYAKTILAWLSQQINAYSKPIIIIGHTDSIPYMGGKNYGNWELSSDRANATRRALIGNGMDESKVLRVIGGADTDLLDQNNSINPANRRIEIIILTDQAAKQIQDQ